MASSSSSGSNYTFKVTIGCETRRFSLPKSYASWHTLCAVLRSSFQQLDGQQHDDLVLYYRDNDHDVITLSSDMELAELLRQPEAVSSTAVRLYGERRQDDAAMAWVFAPEEETTADDNTSPPHLEKAHQVDVEQQDQQQQRQGMATDQRDQFAATFEQLGQLMDRFRETIQDNPEVMRVMGQMASTITTCVSGNTRINLAPLEEWLQSLSQRDPQQQQQQQREGGLYPMPSSLEREDDVPPPPLESLDEHDPPQYEEPSEPYLLYDSKPAASRAHPSMPHPPPPPPPPAPAPAPMFMESSLYPPPPPFIGPLWSRVLRSVGSSLGWNNGHHYSAARYYSPPMPHPHARPPPPPPMSMHPPPQMPLPPRRWESQRRHHRHHDQYPPPQHGFEHGLSHEHEGWDHHYYSRPGRHHHHHHHHPAAPPPPPPPPAPFPLFGAPSEHGRIPPQRSATWHGRHECRHTRAELKRMRKEERKERRMLRKERHAEKKQLRKEKRRARRQARRERRHGDGYESSSSASSTSSSSSSLSSSCSSTDEEQAHEQLAYRMQRLRMGEKDKPAAADTVSKENKRI